MTEQDVGIIAHRVNATHTTVVLANRLSSAIDLIAIVVDGVDLGITAQQLQPDVPHHFVSDALGIPTGTSYAWDIHITYADSITGQQFTQQGNRVQIVGVSS